MTTFLIPRWFPAPTPVIARRPPADEAIQGCNAVVQSLSFEWGRAAFPSLAQGLNLPTERPAEEQFARLKPWAH